MLAIVDTGCANLASVGYAFERLGVQKIITDDAEIIQKAARVVLPGVGTMPFAMAQLKARGLVEVLGKLTQPLLGICLGMQMLFEHSAEGNAAGLGIIKGTISHINSGDLPSPHMGWNNLQILKDDPFLAGVAPGEYVYFVHTYAAPVSSATLATSEYGQPFTAVVKHNNFYGCQFHPERSGKVGAQILENFLKVKP